MIAKKLFVVSWVLQATAAALLLHPRTPARGAIITLGVISGAIVSYLTKLGFVVMNDGGLLFGLAVAVFICSASVHFIRRSQIPVIGPRLAASNNLSSQ